MTYINEGHLERGVSYSGCSQKQGLSKYLGAEQLVYLEDDPRKPKRGGETGKEIRPIRACYSTGY